MNKQSPTRLVFRWTAPKNLIAILLFFVFSIIIEYVIVAFTAPGLAEPVLLIIPLLNFTVSPFYHILPVSVIITLTACFTHLATYIPVTRKTQMSRKPPQRSRRPSKVRLLGQIHRKLRGTMRRVKNKIRRASAIAYVERRIVLAKAIIKSATIVAAVFLITICWVTVAAYPKLVPTVTFDLFNWNKAFFGFIIATIRASETAASTVQPIGAIAASIQSSLAAAAPAFHNSLEGAASSVTRGLVSLTVAEKYLVTQNAAAWTAAMVTLLYTYYTRIRRYRR